MRDTILTIIADAAIAAGLTNVPVTFAAKADNITLPVPRIEVSLGSAIYERTGRRLGIISGINGQQSCKREIYQVTQPAHIILYSDSETWINAAQKALVMALPKGVDDSLGNYCRVRVRSGSDEGFEVQRLGSDTIDPLPKRRHGFDVEVTGRLTTLKPINFIQTISDIDIDVDKEV